MKIKAERDQFSEAVTWATRTVGSRVTLPALSGVLLEARDDRLTCRATDLEVSAEVSVPVQVDGEGQALLPGRLLSQLVARLPDAPVHVQGGPDQVELECGPSTFHVRGMPVEDFPELPRPGEGATRGVVEAEEFVRVVGQVARVASSDEARPVLTGVKLEAGDGQLLAVATDSYRLALRRLAWDPDMESEALVPGRALQEAARAAGEVGGPVTLLVEEAQVSFLFGERRLTTRLIEGSFPDYTQLLPDSHETVVHLDRGPVTEALQRVSVVAAGQSNTPVTLSFREGSLELHAGNQEVGDARESMPVDMDGDSLSIAFNPAFLLSGLDVTGTERVRVELRDGLKPAVFRPEVPEGETAEDFTYLLMPMRVE